MGDTETDATVHVRTFVKREHAGKQEVTHKTYTVTNGVCYRVGHTLAQYHIHTIMDGHCHHSCDGKSQCLAHKYPYPLAIKGVSQQWLFLYHNCQMSNALASLRLNGHSFKYTAERDLKEV